MAWRGSQGDDLAFQNALEVVLHPTDYHPSTVKAASGRLRLHMKKAISAIKALRNEPDAETRLFAQIDIDRLIDYLQDE